MTNRLRDLRVERGISLRALGESAGITFQTLGKIEKGQVRLSEYHAALIAPALGCHPEDLFAENPLTPKQRAFLKTIQDLPDEDLDRLMDWAERMRSS